MAGRPPPRQPGEPDGVQGDLAARQRAEPDEHAEGDGPARCRPAVEVEGDEQGHGDEQAGQRLGHHERVVDPQVRVDRGDRRGDEPDAGPGQAPPDEPDDGDRGDAEQRRGEALPLDVAAAAEAPRREVQRGQRAVLGAGQLGQRLAEPVALAVPAGLDAVVERVVEQQLVVDLDGEEVAEPPHRPDRRDDGEAERRRSSVTARLTAARRAGGGSRPCAGR